MTHKNKEFEWKNNPIVVFAGVLAVYTAGNSIITLFS
ncbi:hypothetical protein SAMN04490355_10181 [Pelosinus propionicus DSM 13327]|uniref:Uncharacterized protein n=1 Tax=Pelosinus propionicus DSM 13327 TaxID=1123291 RepID=A0A1I4KJE6_9FIRM|nr:hypothetical protein SAMN04490355_10181 [Pelosinus propionicus DSM 13327]